MQMLILRGHPVYSQMFSSRVYLPRAAELLAWVEAELATRHSFITLILGCGVYGSDDLPPAQRSQLMKLRGSGNADARMRIARCLGVRTSRAVLQRLRDAAEVWCRGVVPHLLDGPSF